MQVREKVGKSRNTVFFQWFVAPEGQKVGSLKRRARSHLARWEMKNCTPLWPEARFEVKMHKTHQARTTFGSWDVEKVHAVVARSAFRSQNVQNTPGLDHFWKLKCRKSVRRCGEKQISKSKCTKHTRSGPFLEVEMSKKCTPLWCEAHFEVKMYNTHQVRTIFGSWDVEKVHAVVARSTFRSQNVNVRSIFNYSHQYTTIHSNTLQLQWHPNYIPLHYTTLHYIPLHYTTIHYTTLHSTTPSYTQLHSVTLNYTQLHSITLHYTTFRYTTLRYTTIHYPPLHYITLHYIPLHYISLHYTPLHHTTTTLHFTTLHYIPLHSTTLHSITLHCTTLHYATLHYTTLTSTTTTTTTILHLHYATLHWMTLLYTYNYNCTTTATTTTLIALHYTTLHHTTPHHTTLHSITLLYTTLPQSALHYITLQYTHYTTTIATATTLH